MNPLFCILLCAAAAAHTVSDTLVVNHPARFLAGVDVQGNATLGRVLINGSLDMQHRPITHAGATPPVFVTATSAVSMDTAAAVFVVDASAAAVIVSMVGSDVYHAMHFVRADASANGILVNFGTQGYRLEAADSHLAVVATPARVATLSTHAVTNVSTSAYTKVAEPIAGLAAYPHTSALSRDGLTLVTASFNDNDQRGVAYVFTRSGSDWNYVQNLTASDGAQFDEFGISVDVNADGTTIVVGADGVDNYAGAAYVFTLSGTWTQQARLDPTTPYSGLIFGNAVAISDPGDTVAVGSGDMGSAGAAYVYSRSAGVWSSAADLTGEADAKAADMFGETVDISGDGATLIVGSRDANPGSPDRSAYIFVDSGGWACQQRLTPPPTALSETNFGSGVRLSEDGQTVAVASPGTNAAENGAYMYTRAGVTWVYKGLLPAGAIATGDSRGHDILMNRDASLVFMQSYAAAAPPAAGHAHMYSSSGSAWAYVRAVEIDGSENGHAFGKKGGVSADGLTVALQTTTYGPEHGAVYLFMW